MRKYKLIPSFRTALLVLLDVCDSLFRDTVQQDFVNISMSFLIVKQASAQCRSVRTFTVPFYTHFHSTALYALSHYRSVRTFTVPLCTHFHSTALYALSQYRSVRTFTLPLCTHFHSTTLYALSQYRSVRTFTAPLCTHFHVRTSQSLLSDMHPCTPSPDQNNFTFSLFPPIRCKDSANCLAHFPPTSNLFPLQCLLMERHKFHKHAPSHL